MKWKLILAAAWLALGLGVCGCGGEEPATPAADKPEVTQERQETETAQPASPKELAQATFEVFMEGYDAVADMAAAPPPIAEAKAALEALKQDMIQRLVAMGHTREAMSPVDKSAFDSGLRSSLMHIEQDKVVSFNDTVTHYRQEDNSFANDIAQFNIITQYTNFDLLKQQAPEEAARLGIE